MFNKLFKNKNLEQAIADYDYLGKQIKALEEERKDLKDSLVTSYFGENPIYRDANDCILATYDEKSRELIKGKELKLALPDVYIKYSYTSSWMELRVK